MMVGAIAMLGGLSVLLAGTRHTATRGRDARHKLETSRRETAFLNQERDQRLAHDQNDADADATGPIVTRRRPTLFGRRPAGRHQGGSATEVDASGRTSTVATVAQSRATDNDRQGVRNEGR